MTTLLHLCQDAAGLIGLPEPDSIIGSTDETAVRLKAASNREGRALARRHNWPELTKEATFTTSAAEDQGLFSALGSGPADYSDFDRMIPNTVWDRTDNRPLNGPLTDVEYQSIRSSSFSGPYYNFRIRGGRFLTYPTPTAGNTVSFEYVSKYWVDTDDDSAGEADSWQADTDTPVLNDELMLLGTIWRFKQSIGEDYAEDFRNYEAEVAAAIGRAGSRRTLTLARRSRGRVPGVIVPDGSWSV